MSDTENIRTYYLHESGSIPGVPGPNNGLWPGGMMVKVDMNTNEVVFAGVMGEVVEQPEQPATPPALPPEPEPEPINRMQ